MPWLDYCRACLSLRFGRSLISIVIIGLLLVSLTLPSHFTRALSSKTYSFTPTHAKNYLTSGSVDFADTSAVVAWHDDAWAYRQQVTINKEFVGEELIDFPVLIQLTDQSGSSLRDDLNDLVVTSADGMTKLPHEVEGSAIWVRVPRLLPTADTILYLYSGNPTVAATQAAPQNVWMGDYLHVWHFNTTPEAGAPDATSADKTLSHFGGSNDGSDRTGKIGQSLSLDGSNDYINAASVAVPYTGTMSMWWKPNQAVGSTRNPLWRSDGPVQNRLFEINSWSGNLFIAGWYYDVSGEGNDDRILWTTTELSQGNWYHVAVTWTEGGDTILYINGERKASTSNLNAVWDTSAITTYIGRTAGGIYAKANVDDIRLQSAVRSPAWLRAEYANQCDCEDFLQINPDVETPSTSPLSGGTVATVQLKADRPLPFSSLQSFVANAGGKSPTFQLSNDAGQTWLFYASTGSAQAPAGAWKGANPVNPQHRSSANDINGHLSSFPTGKGQLLWKAFLPSGTSLDQIQVTYISRLGIPITSLSDPRIQAINTLFLQAFDRSPTEAEWLYWATRLINGEKNVAQDLLGAMQWANQTGRPATGGPVVEIRNGTNRQGLAKQTLTAVTEAGYHVSAVGNAQNFLREQSKVYVLNHTKLAEAEELAATLKIPSGLDLPPGERDTTADILVILGYDFGE